jgi:hypothetical protein
MAGTDEELRREIGAEREQLAAAVETLRGEVGKVTAIPGKVRAKLPLAAAGTVGLGVLGATVRLLRRSRR